MKKVNADKWELPCNLFSNTRPDRRPVFHKIEHKATVISNDGTPMEMVSIQGSVDLYDPTDDIAALVGRVANFKLLSGVDSPHAPEIWFWNDRFWLKAVAPHSHTVYYRQHCYLFYEVTLVDRAGLLGSIRI